MDQAAQPKTEPEDFPLSAWSSVANRPGANYSYTNNFPYDPDVGNLPVPGALLWSALSLMVLLIGIGVGTPLVVG